MSARGASGMLVCPAHSFLAVEPSAATYFDDTLAADRLAAKKERKREIAATKQQITWRWTENQLAAQRVQAILRGCAVRHNDADEVLKLLYNYFDEVDKARTSPSNHVIPDHLLSDGRTAQAHWTPVN